MLSPSLAKKVSQNPKLQNSLLTLQASMRQKRLAQPKALGPAHHYYGPKRNNLPYLPKLLMHPPVGVKV